MDDPSGRERTVKTSRLRGILGTLALFAGVSAAACEGRGTPAASASEPAMITVAVPDFSEAVDAPVRARIRERHAAVDALAGDPRSTKLDLSRAYGELGKVLMAAEYRQAAEASFLNARHLDPKSRQWAYYLGHLYRNRGDLAKAAAFFEEALALQPEDVPTRVWLADVYLSQGRPDPAEPLLTRALASDPGFHPNAPMTRVGDPGVRAVLFGLGRVALARKDYAGAVRQFEAVLAADKEAAAVHYPLAMAYRGLGNMEKAEAHVKQRRDGAIVPPDPLMNELGSLVESAAAYERRGTEALTSGDWATAVAQFRKGLALAPDDPALRHRLGTALFQTGDVRGAFEAFEQVVRVSPHYARAHYSLGVLEQASGRSGAALDRFTAAVQSDPDYVEARLALAALMRRSGRAQGAIEHYQHVLRINPRAADAAFGHAMALVSLGRYQEARDRLSEGITSYPDHTGFPHALARLLAAAPDARVRDGQRAMTLMKPLVERQQTLELGETMAMTLAEVGRFDEAAAFQRDVIAESERSARGDLARRMADNLRLYERRQACRTPWREGELP